MYVNVSRSEEESAESEDERKRDGRKADANCIRSGDLLSLVAENCNLLQTAIANTVLIPPESTVNRVAQMQLVTHRLHIRSPSLAYRLSGLNIVYTEP